jgi:hypothetical protein
MGDESRATAEEKEDEKVEEGEATFCASMA